MQFCTGFSRNTSRRLFRGLGRGDSRGAYVCATRAGGSLEHRCPGVRRRSRCLVGDAPSGRLGQRGQPARALGWQPLRGAAADCRASRGDALPSSRAHAICFRSLGRSQNDAPLARSVARPGRSRVGAYAPRLRTCERRVPPHDRRPRSSRESRGHAGLCVATSAHTRDAGPHRLRAERDSR